MSGKMSRAIVIDASIARASGKTDHPVSKACRDFLENTLRICHRVVLSAESAREWRKHRSRFSLTWLASMTSKGKMIKVPSTDQPSLKNEIHDLPLQDNKFPAIIKDLHLVEAALASDYVVASLDDKARGHFHETARHLPTLRKVAWVNPANESEEAIHWLKTGARPETKRRLGISALNKSRRKKG